MERVSEEIPKDNRFLTLINYIKYESKTREFQLKTQYRSRNLAIAILLQKISATLRNDKE